MHHVWVRAGVAYKRLFLVPKPNNKWWPFLDLSSLNKFLKVQTFKLETPESIRLSLQTGEWVSSLDFSDTYFHIPISQSSKKYLRFHCQNQTFQFTAPPFGLSTAPMEFTIVIKEVRLVAEAHHIQIHPCLDEWLIRTKAKTDLLSKHPVLLCPLSGARLGCDIQQSELNPQQIVGYQFN